ncbi:MAG: 50S ribosome-binding GTPase [Bacteroidetes bacterium]|nr:50S ribosome-binding GTPase [Bacteroidota bacterium]MBU2584064.1 50S ribosome-binding GTPase [Bacteroidota bacterium]
MTNIRNPKLGSIKNQPNLYQIGLISNRDHKIIALAGNPNTGKSTVFNQLTGLKQHTGNWPGKTVIRAEGKFLYKNQNYLLIDLPGTYSLLSTSEDEEIARNFILFGKPDVTVVVVDSTSLERNLNLVLQILQITNRVIVCCNLIDEAERKGIQINRKMLEKDLGVPVIPTNARGGKGLDELLEMIDSVANKLIVPNPRKIDFKKELKEKLDQLVPLIESTFLGIHNAEWIAIRLIEGDEKIRQALIDGNFNSLIEENGSVG